MKVLSTSQVSTVVADADSVDAAILSRFSARAYLNKPVEKSVLEDLLQVAARAPSGTNTQPWKVHVLTGTAKAELTRRILAPLNSLAEGARKIAAGDLTARAVPGDRSLAVAASSQRARSTGLSVGGARTRGVVVGRGGLHVPRAQRRFWGYIFDFIFPPISQLHRKKF